MPFVSAYLLYTKHETTLSIVTAREENKRHYLSLGSGTLKQNRLFLERSTLVENV